MVSVLFVCLGNICRSPAGEAILQTLAAAQGMSSRLHIRSCGLGDWHVGLGADARMISAAKERGYMISTKASLFDDAYFRSFDYILAADRTIFQRLQEKASTPSDRAKIIPMTAYSKTYKGGDVPDPYNGDTEGFFTVIDILEDSCRGLLAHLKVSGRR